MPDPSSRKPAILMSWQDLLFAHWRVEARRLRPLIPAALEIDTFRGDAWLGVVPFRMSGVRWAGLPAVPGLRHFPELNLRTYVRHGDRPGVWFFSLDATNPVAVRAARLTFRLPYFDAAITVTEDENGGFRYVSQRTHRGAPAGEFSARYRPVGPVRFAEPGTLEFWQTERYSLFTSRADGTVLRGDIQHDRWPLQAAEAEFEKNTLGEGFGLPLPGGPETLAFARRVAVTAFWPRLASNWTTARR